MAYRRRHTTPRFSTFEDIRSFLADDDENTSPSIAAKAIRASAAHRDSSHSAAYNGDSTAFNPPSATPVLASVYSPFHHTDRRRFVKQGSNVYEYSSSIRTSNPRNGFWDVLAKKTNAILEDDKAVEQIQDGDSNPSHMLNSEDGQVRLPSKPEGKWSPDRKTENPTFQKEAIASKLKEFRGKIETEGTRRNNNGSHTTNSGDTPEFTQNQIEYEEKINASKKVANAMVAKVKLLLGELKTVKADLAFIKERSTQLEEENKTLRENRQKGAIPADDDLIRHQLETLLAEKARLAHENSVYARENRFLREIVEYHQLTMQDVVDLDAEGIEEDTEVYPIHQRQTLTSSSCSTHDVSSSSPSFSTDPTMPRSHALQTCFTDSVVSMESSKPPTSPNRMKKGSPSASPNVKGPMQQQHISSATPP